MQSPYHSLPVQPIEMQRRCKRAATPAAKIFCLAALSCRAAQCQKPENRLSSRCGPRRAKARSHGDRCSAVTFRPGKWNCVQHAGAGAGRDRQQLEEQPAIGNWLSTRDGRRRLGGKPPGPCRRLFGVPPSGTPQLARRKECGSRSRWKAWGRQHNGCGAADRTYSRLEYRWLESVSNRSRFRFRNRSRAGSRCRPASASKVFCAVAHQRSCPGNCVRRARLLYYK